MQTKLPQWIKVLVVLAVLWVAYRILMIWFPDPIHSLMALFGIGAGASMLASNHRALREKEIEETKADRAELQENRKAVDKHKEEIADLNRQLQQIPITVNQELKEELDSFAEAKKRIVEQEMTEDEAVDFLRQRLKARRENSA